MVCEGMIRGGMIREGTACEGMVCGECDERMVRETTVTVIRGRFRNRSVATAGWYCWACNASVYAVAEAVEPEPKALPGRAKGGVRPDWQWQSRHA